MKIIAVNGSPRRNWNTAALLKQALAGAAAAGAETELIHLYELDFKGCLSCFSCKRKGGAHVCAVQDGLTPVLAKLSAADALIFGSPVYFMKITSGLSACLERFVYPILRYDPQNRSAFSRPLPSAFVYTMNATEEFIAPFKAGLNPFEGYAKTTLREAPELLYACDTWQFPDYDRYENSMFSAETKAKHKAEQFPRDCEAAFRLGAKLAARARELAAG